MARASNNTISIRADERLKEDAAVTSSFNLDYSLFETWNLTLIGNTTLTESNLPTSGSRTRVIVLRVTGNFTLTLPAGWSTEIKGVYVGTVQNLIVVQYFKSTIYSVEISQPD